MEFKQTENTLIVYDTPGCFWLFGLFFITIGGLFLGGGLGLFANLQETSYWARMLAGLLGLAAVAAGVYVVYTSPRSQAEFEGDKGTVTLKRRGLLRTKKEVYRIADIDEIYLGEKSDSDGDPVYRVMMRLKPESEVALSILWIHNRPKLENAAQAAQEFLASWKDKFKNRG